ncbi:MAG: hypothetical protein ABEK17_03715, partial [Candidatus Aenigmatarchaeota archaeon]
KEKEVKKSMFAVADGTPKPEVRSELTEKYQNEGKPIQKLTVREYSKKPFWMKEEKWSELLGNN